MAAPTRQTAPLVSIAQHSMAPIANICCFVEYFSYYADADIIVYFLPLQYTVVWFHRFELALEPHYVDHTESPRLSSR